MAITAQFKCQKKCEKKHDSAVPGTIFLCRAIGVSKSGGIGGVQNTCERLRMKYVPSGYVKIAIENCHL